MVQTSKDLRRYVMRGTSCTSQEATDFFAHIGMFFSERAKQDELSSFESAAFMAVFDLMSRAAVEQDDEI